MSSTSGASLFIALLFLLMCTLAGSVVLTAATTSAGRLVNLKKDEQDYYTVVSALKLLKQELEGQKYTKYIIKTPSGQTIAEDYYEKPNGKLQELLIDLADKAFDFYKDTNRLSSEKDILHSEQWKMKLSHTSLEEVVANVSIGRLDQTNNRDGNKPNNKSYEISITISQGDRSYKLNIPAVVSKREEIIYGEEVEKIQIKEITTVLWTKGEIVKN